MPKYQILRTHAGKCTAFYHPAFESAALAEWIFNASDSPALDADKMAISSTEISENLQNSGEQNAYEPECKIKREIYRKELNQALGHNNNSPTMRSKESKVSKAILAICKKKVNKKQKIVQNKFKYIMMMGVGAKKEVRQRMPGRKRKKIFFENEKRPDIFAVVIIDRPDIIYLNARGNPKGLIVLIKSLEKK